jgi:hypothetical protein
VTAPAAAAPRRVWVLERETGAGRAIVTATTATPPVGKLREGWTAFVPEEGARNAEAALDEIAERFTELAETCGQVAAWIRGRQRGAGA